MCGIVGIFGQNDEDVLDKMLQSIVHRGPDGHGIHADDTVNMGACRLSIVDIERGTQPMYNEAGDVVVVFNGEIYNHQRIRDELRDRGHRFETDCDTEVLVHLWEEHGLSMVDYLDGMFAFSLYDIEEETVFLARDPLGIKPLYYAADDRSIRWASEIRPLLIGGVDTTLDSRAVADFFSLRYSPWSRTLFEDISKLPPGSTLIVDKDGLTVDRYWRPTPQNVQGSLKSVATQLREMLDASVEKRLMADTPVGAYLSGGLDSSAVVGLMADRVDHLKTYSVGFDAGDVDEREEAAFVAEHFGTDHTTIDVDLQSLDLFEDMIAHLSEPLADPAALPNIILSQRAVKDVKVVQTGVGADELFAGYRYHSLLTEHRRILRNLPQPIFDFVEKLRRAGFDNKYTRHLANLESDERAYMYWRQRYETPPEEYLDCEVDEEALRRFIRESFPGGSEGKTLQRLLAIDIEHYVCDDLLYLLDHMTMANSIEGRVPFLDTGIVDFALGIPERYQIEGHNKPVLRRAVDDVLPDRTLQREKQTFAVPIGDWFSDDHPAIATWFQEETLRATPYVDADIALSLFTDHRRGRANNRNSLWRILSFVSWYQTNVAPWR